MKTLAARLRAVPRGYLMAAVPAAVLMPLLGWPGSAPGGWPVATVREEPFVETLVEHGTLGAARLMFYGSEIAGGPAKIAWIAREGTYVSKGDLLIRFDGASFAEELARERAALLQAEADLAAAREAGRLEAMQAEADVDDARDQIGYAESELKDEVDGAGRVALAEAEAAAAELDREVARTRRDYEDLKPMLARGFITQMELERAEQAWHRAMEQRRLAGMKRDALIKYGRPAAVDRARRALDDARRDLEREAETASARLAARRAAVQLAEGKVTEIAARVAAFEARLAATEVRAEGSGLVVYRDLFFGSDRRKPQVGDEVWPKQPVIALPDSEGLVVETRVREVDLMKVSASQQVTVTVEAYPGVRLPAAVELIGALAEETAAYGVAKSFPVTIALRDSDARLRPGMTARVEIQVAAHARALVLPLGAVFGTAGAQYCYVLRAGRPDRRPITVLADDGLDAAVRGDVNAGDQVLLVDPDVSEPR